jgi:hypothetical protein
MGLHTVAGGELGAAVLARSNVGPRLGPRLGPRFPRHREGILHSLEAAVDQAKERDAARSFSPWAKVSLAAKAEGLLEVWGNNCSIRSLKRNETPTG